MFRDIGKETLRRNGHVGDKIGRVSCLQEHESGRLVRTCPDEGMIQ